MSASYILRVFLDPRGRCDRQGLLVIAGGLLVAQLAFFAALSFEWLSPTGPVAMAMNALFLWSAIAATIKRLHDTDRSGWVVLKAAAALMLSAVLLSIGLMFVLPDEAFHPGATGYLIVLAGLMGPLLGMCLWLHCAKGMTESNRFGPAPGASGFSDCSRRVR